MEQEFISLRNRYLPNELRVIFILESPPQGHSYFYDPAGRVSEILFRSFMKLIDFVPRSKEEGLTELARRGYLLVNPTYTPVNKLPDREADQIILANYPNFLKDLNGLLGGNKSIPVIIVKSNVLRLLEKPLLADGYNVRNGGTLVPFPLHYHLNTFLERVKKLLTADSGR